MPEPQIQMDFWKNSSFLAILSEKSVSRYAWNKMARLSTELQDVSWNKSSHHWMLKRGLSRSDASAHSSLGYVNMTVTAFRLWKWWPSKPIIFANGLRQLLQWDVAMGHCRQGTSSFLAASCATITYPNTSKMLSQNLSATRILDAV